jgi:Flp pilus assembly protein TadG
MLTAWSKFRRTQRAFRRAREGNVAITFAIAIVPILAFVGAAVDFGSANSVQASFQSALDSTALMLSKEATTDTAAELQANAQKYFAALFNQPKTSNIVVTASYSTDGGAAVVVTGSASVPTTFMSVLGYNSISIGGSSTTKWGSTRLRVALVLDNTGSMGQSGKLTALQTATKNLLTQLQNAATTNGDVYVSIVPFVKDVNLDPANYSAYWIDWTDWDAANGTCNKSMYNSQSSCTSNKGKWTSDNHNKWNGCVVDRGDANKPNTANYDTNVDVPTTSITATLFSAEQYSSCPQASMGLSYDWSTMTQIVNDMSPAGNTNQAIGLAVGWMSLVGGGPFTAVAMDPNYKYQQVIILLTDGLNTQDRWYTNQSQIDARQQMTCDNIKSAGIILYTIQVDTGGDPTSTLLQNCASNNPGTTDHFFLLTSANEIVTTFNQIGTNLTQLYLAK